jgi:hypothetical protein
MFTDLSSHAEFVFIFIAKGRNADWQPQDMFSAMTVWQGLTMSEPETTYIWELKSTYEHGIFQSNAL